MIPLALGRIIRQTNSFRVELESLHAYQYNTEIRDGLTYLGRDLPLLLTHVCQTLRVVCTSLGTAFSRLLLAERQSSLLFLAFALLLWRKGIVRVL